MLLKIYELMLRRKIKKVPRHIMIVSDVDDWHAFRKFVEWCRKFGVEEITLCTDNADRLEGIENIRLRIVRDGVKEEIGEGELTVNIVSGFGGREEIVNAVRRLAEKVVKGELNPESVSESAIEENLTLKSQPDLIIKAGNEIPEFLIWQTIYSELYFADIDWKYLRFVDFLRILREYQRRERRYGR